MAHLICEQYKRIGKTVEELNIQKWDSEGNPSLTRDYGYLRFNDGELDENVQISQYIRLSLKTETKVVIEFLRSGWRLRRPDLIISITGGAKHCDLSPRLRRAFQSGLVSSAAATNAWIITAGTNSGVVKEVGQALNNYRYKNKKNTCEIPCIGIASWGYTAGNEQLLQKDEKVDKAAENKKILHNSTNLLQLMRSIDESLNPDQFIHVYKAPKKVEKRCDLEPNHTHFLLFDDGLFSANTVLQLRAHIEAVSRTIAPEHRLNKVSHTLIPIVMILVEGGKDSVKTVCEALESRTPVVLIKGSGRAADLVSDVLLSMKRYKRRKQELENHRKRILEEHNIEESKIDESQSDESNVNRLSEELDMIFTFHRTANSWVDESRESLCLVLSKFADLVTVFDFDCEEHDGMLDRAVIEAVFNSIQFEEDENKHLQLVATMRLALAWNNVDFARKDIFSESKISKWQVEDLREGLIEALRRNYTDFIDLFIEYGVTLESLTHANLDYLYSTGSTENCLPLSNSTDSSYTREEFYEEYLAGQYMEQKNDDDCLGETAARDLFFWAIFMNHFRLAVYLASKTWEQSLTLLAGARIYQKALKLALDQETYETYSNNIRELDNCAASIIDLCFKRDRDFAINIVRRRPLTLNNVSPLKLALKANCRSFLASKCVQQHLDHLWYGRINYNRQNIQLKIILCSLFFPLLPIFSFLLPFIDHTIGFNVDSRVFGFSQRVGKTHKRPVKFYEKFILFYKAPIVRFYYHLIFFILFLVLFSYVMLLDFHPVGYFAKTPLVFKDLKLSIKEIILHVCIWGLIIEEIRQFLSMRSNIDYFKELTNLFDLAAIILYLVGLGLRFIPNENCFTAAKVTMGLDLILWYIRMLHLFAAYERLGPKLLMIFDTMKDLLFFICFIIIFLFAFSVTSWTFTIAESQVSWKYGVNGTLTNVTVMSSKQNQTTLRLIYDITNFGIWKIFASVDPIEVKNIYSTLVFFLNIVFVTIANILLLNVLIALFNVTITAVEGQSKQIWRYQRFLLVVEFRKKSCIPPPVNVIDCLLTLCSIYRAKGCKINRGSYFGIPGTKIEDQLSGRPPIMVTEAMKREKAIADDFWHGKLEELRENGI